MNVAMLTPLPPARTGVAHYVSLLLPALGREVDVHAFASLDGYRREDFDCTIYQLGNNPHHEFVYREALEHPGVSVLHDVVLHHLIVEMTLARGDAGAYIEVLKRNHGEAGAAWARGRAAGLHSEMGNFLLPASVEVANRSLAVIVHNQYAAGRLRSFGVTVPIHVVPHPRPGAERSGDRPAIRKRLGFDPASRVIGFFGFLTSAKRAEIVLEAFARARRRHTALHLLVVGEPAPDINLALFRGEGITFTGYVGDEEFDHYYAAADRVVNLRYPTAGETSGTLIRAFAAGRPVAVSDYAQFAELPDDCVVRIPLGGTEIEALAGFFSAPLDEQCIAAAQRRWLAEHAAPEMTVRGYLAALGASGGEGESDAGVTRTLPLFPALQVVAVSGNVLTIRNCGESVLRARSYGEPAYRLIAKLFAGGGEIADRWIEFSRDLEPGGEVAVELPSADGATLRLYHAMEGIPMLEPEAWYDTRLR